MRIGIDARNLIPSLTGIGRYVFEMCRQLEGKGHEIFLYLPEEPSSPLPQWPGMTAHIGNYVGSIQRTIWGQTVLPRIAATDHLDVFWGPAHRLPLRLDSRVPRVVTIHDLVWLYAANTMRPQTWVAETILMKPAIRSACRIVTVSLATAAALREVVPEASDKIRVIYPGLTHLHGNKLDSSFDGFAEKHAINRPYGLFVGTLEPRKNLPRLLEAYALLSEETRNKFLLVIAGGQGWRLGDLRALISRLGIQSSVRLTGYVSDADLADLYSNARFLAMPSLYEGFGFPIIEANAAGVPVMTSNSSSMPEVVGDAGLLVVPTDVNSIVAAMNELMNNDQVYDQLKGRARLNAARFSWDKGADALLKVFEDARRVKY